MSYNEAYEEVVYWHKNVFMVLVRNTDQTNTFNLLDQWQATKQHSNESDLLYANLTSTKAKQKFKGKELSESITKKTEIMGKGEHQ